MRASPMHATTRLRRRRLLRCAAFALCTVFSTGAVAQVRLPGVPLGLPALPSAARDLQSLQTLTQDGLTEARAELVRRLLREHPRELDRDRAGNPVLRSRLLALAPTPAALAALAARGFEVVRDEPGDQLGVRVVTLRVPERLSTRAALDEARKLDPEGLYEFDHVYLGSGVASAGAAPPAPPEPVPPGTATVRVGLVDTGLESTHPAFASAAVHPWGCDGASVAASHGTAVASLLVEHGARDLYAADVYCGRPTGGAVDAIVSALEWLARQHVAVVNLSLVGPANGILERVVAALVARGHLLVAAVGNDGPASPPLYPAAYPGVVGVTGVDARRHVLVEAVQGLQVTFAAAGANITAAGLHGARVEVRGTSFAAPAVAARLAALLSSPDPQAAQSAIVALAAGAIDLGRPGRDTIYGFGLVVDPGSGDSKK